MKLGLVAVILASTGCELIIDIPNPSTSREAPNADAGADTTVPPDIQIIDAAFCAGTYRPWCVDPADEDIVLGDTLDTVTNARCVVVDDAGGVGPVCVIAARSITITAGTTTRVTGARPLVLLGETSLAIDGTLDVAAHVAIPGPASNIGCGTPTAVGEASGGAGGSRAGQGGSGGMGGDDGVGGVAGGPTPLSLHGGCSGEAGQGGALGGAGGGSVSLVSASTLSITGVVNASGGAGAGAANLGGGGGGGSGGVIIIDAPAPIIGGIVIANGGGGGEGGRGGLFSGSGPGNAGADPNPAAPGPGGVGGSGTTGGDGGNGGNGSVGTLQANGGAGGRMGRNIPTGGGGGGAAGIIKVTGTPTLTGFIVPTPS